MTLATLNVCSNILQLAFMILLMLNILSLFMSNPFDHYALPHAPAKVTRLTQVDDGCADDYPLVCHLLYLLIGCALYCFIVAVQVYSKVRPYTWGYINIHMCVFVYLLLKVQMAK